MPEIAAAAELAPGTLYLYFPSKDVLYIELLVGGSRKLLSNLQFRPSGPALPDRKAAALIDAFLHSPQTEPQYFDIIFFVLQQELGGPQQALHPDQMQRLQAVEEACKGVAAAVLRQVPGQKGEAALRVTVDAIWSMLAGVVFFWRRDRGLNSARWPTAPGTWCSRHSLASRRDNAMTASRVRNEGGPAWQRGFWSLIATQFQGAFNENGLKNLVVFLILGMGMHAVDRDRLVLGGGRAVLGAVSALLHDRWISRRPLQQTHGDDLDPVL